MFMLLLMRARSDWLVSGVPLVVWSLSDMPAAKNGDGVASSCNPPVVRDRDLTFVSGHG